MSQKVGILPTVNLILQYYISRLSISVKVTNVLALNQIVILKMSIAILVSVVVNRSRYIKNDDNFVHFWLLLHDAASPVCAKRIA